MQEEAVNEVSVLSDYDTTFLQRKRDELCVRRAVAQREFESVSCIVPSIVQPLRHAPGQLRINQKLHVASGSARLV